ncbi:hypothetical protein [Cupriavidus neocaledonicus]|uniref:Chemotaxis sensory transducer n=1 Tax=Cupriavidus neocaledonicus TaxID=1040979 RepID=A0A375HCT8_9BURK
MLAGEVRQLAHRCGAATREIRGLIYTSVERAHAGTERVGHTGETMFEENAELVAGAAEAARAEQAQTKRLNRAVAVFRLG